MNCRFKFFILLSLFLIGINSSQAQPVRGNPGDLWADLILGQPSFGQITANQVGNKGLFNAYSAVVDNLHNRLYLYDSGNNRVLGVSNLESLTSGQGADVVLGQLDFTHSACNGDSNWQNYPDPPVPNDSCLCGLRYDFQSPAEGGSVGNMAVDSQGNLYVPDYFNNRILRYDWPISTGMAASHIWGQPDFTQYQYNNIGGNIAGSPSPSNLYFFFNSVPDNHYYAGVAVDNWGNLWVADAMNNRALRFPNPNFPTSGIPSSTADVVLGQNNFISSLTPSGFSDLTHLKHPGAVRVDSSGNVFVTDLIPNGLAPFYFGGRVLVYKPTGYDASGQPRYGATNTGLTASGSVTQYMDQVDGLEWDPSGDLWVSQYYQSVLLHFTLSPSVSAVVTKVLMEAAPIGPGQVYNATSGDEPNFIDNAGETASSFLLGQDLRGSVGVDSSGNIYAPGGKWQDVLRFPAPIPAIGSLPAGEAHSADLQVFKPSQFLVMNNIGNNDMFVPTGVAVAAGQIIEANVNRLAFWNIPSGPSGLTNGQSADGFAGAPFPDLWLSNPFGRIREDKASPQHLWVIHNMNGTVQVEPFLLPLHNGDMPMAGKTLHSPLPILGGGSLSWTAMEGLAVDPSGNYLWLSDKLGNRVFRVRDPLGVGTGPVVDIILGQPNASATGCNVGGSLQSDQICTSGTLNASTLYVPGAITLDHHGDLFVSDHSLENEGNYRLLRFNAASIQNNSTSTALFGVAAVAAYGTNGSFGTTGCQSANGVCGPWEAAFNADDSRMVVGLNSQAPSIKFPIVLSNPLSGDTPSGHLQDFGPQTYASTFDDQDNLYTLELNRNRILVYYQPFGAPSPLPTFTPTPTGSATPTPTLSSTSTSTLTKTATPIPTGVYAMRVNANGYSMTSTDGRLWLQDKTYSAGSYGYTGSTSTVQGSCSPLGVSPSDYPLYNTVRYAGSMDYKFDLPQADTYYVTLYFDECFHNPGESRIFKILMQGTQVDQFDLVPLCVAPDGTRYLLSKTYAVTLTAANLTLDIGFQGVVDYALVAAIQVVGTLQVGTPTFTNSPTPIPTSTPTYTPSPTFSPTPTGSATPTPTNTLTITPSNTPTGSNTPTPTSTFTPTAIPTGVYVTRVNADGSSMTSTDGKFWLADQAYSLGSYGYTGSTTTVTGGCAPVGVAPADYPLYNPIRYGMSFNYKFDLPQPDTYQVTLYFDECFHNPGESRIFQVLMQGIQVDQFDLVPLCVGPTGTRYLLTKTYDVTLSGANPTLVVGFVGVNDNALISAIQVVGTSQLNTATPTYTITSSSTPTYTLATTPTNTPPNTYTNSPTNSTTNTPVNTFTNTPTATPTNSPPNTPTTTPMSSPIPTLSMTWTYSLTPTITISSTFTVTPTATKTPSNSPTNSVTTTDSATSTATNTGTLPTSTPTFTPTPAATSPGTIGFRPNPSSGGPVILTLPGRGSANIKIVVFTTAFRKVQEMDVPNFILGTTGNGPILGMTDSWGNPLASGLYYVIVTITPSSQKGQRLIGKLLILR